MDLKSTHPHFTGSLPTHPLAWPITFSNHIVEMGTRMLQLCWTASSSQYHRRDETTNNINY